MKSARRIVRSAALFEFLAATAGARIVAADLWPASNHLPDFLLSAEVKIIVNQATRLAGSTVFPVGMHFHQRQFDFVDPFLRIARALGDIDAICLLYTSDAADE